MCVFLILLPKQNSLSGGIRGPLPQICLCLLLLLFTQLRGTSVVVSHGCIPIDLNWKQWPLETSYTPLGAEVSWEFDIILCLQYFCFLVFNSYFRNPNSLLLFPAPFFSGWHLKSEDWNGTMLVYVLCLHTDCSIFQTESRRGRERNFYFYFQRTWSCAMMLSDDITHFSFMQPLKSCVLQTLLSHFESKGCFFSFAWKCPGANWIRLPRGRVWFAPSQRVMVLSIDTFQSLIKAVRDCPTEIPIKYRGSWFLQLLIIFPLSFPRALQIVKTNFISALPISLLCDLGKTA